jgi:MFS family permease
VTAGAGRLTRDSATWLVYLQLSTFATMLYGLSAALPLIRIDQGTSQTVAGLHGTALAAGAIVCGLMMGRLTRRFGRRRVVWFGLAGMDLGVLLIAAFPVLPVTLAGFFLANTAAQMTLFGGMAALSEHHGAEDGPAAISEANAVAVTVGVATTLLLSVLAQAGFGWRVGLLIPTVATVLLAVTMGRVWTREAPAVAVVSGPKVPFGMRFHVAGVVLLSCVAVEFCFNLWAAKLFADQTGLSAAAAATGLTAFTAGVAVGRFTGARLALRYSPAVLLVGALGVTAVGWLLFWGSTSVLLGYAGLMLSGLGVAVQFPMCVALLIGASGGRPDAAVARASIFGGIGLGAGPFVLGALADGFGTHGAFLLAPALMGVAVAGLLSCR